MPSPQTARRQPRQARSRQMVDAILEAAAQLLEARGEAGFNTNAVAERAGVSIGSLYRYFPDKRAILTALARREGERTDAEMAAALSGDRGALAPDRAAIRAFLRAFDGRSKARRIAVSALLAHADPRDLAAGFTPVEAAYRDPRGRPLTPVQAFVLSRAVHGAMRAAVLEGAAFLASPAFEDELVRLARSYIVALPPQQASPEL